MDVRSRLQYCLKGLPGFCSISFLLCAAPTWSQPQLVLSHSAADLAEPSSAISDPSTDPKLGSVWRSPRFAEIPSLVANSPPSEQQPSDIINSPVLEKWQKRVPNILEDIKRDPSFRTRVRLGISDFPSTFDSVGWNAGVEDIVLLKAGNTGLTISGDYQATFSGKRKAGGAHLRYYLLPLGGYVNVAPVLGYRYLETPRYITDGLEVGFRVQIVPSRTGATDLSLTQTWVDPRQGDEVGVTTLSFGYALTHHLRLSTDVQKQNSKQKKDTRFGLSLEWML